MALVRTVLLIYMLAGVSAFAEDFKVDLTDTPQPSDGIELFSDSKSLACTPQCDGQPACGDGTVTLPNGITPQPCSIVSVDPNLVNP